MGKGKFCWLSSFFKTKSTYLILVAISSLILVHKASVDMSVAMAMAISDPWVYMVPKKNDLSACYSVWHPPRSLTIFLCLFIFLNDCQASSSCGKKQPREGAVTSRLCGRVRLQARGRSWVGTAVRGVAGRFGHGQERDELRSRTKTWMVGSLGRSGR